MVLIIYWVLLAGRAKPSVSGRWKWPREIGLRLAVLVVVLLVLHLVRAHHMERYVVNTNRVLGFCGAALCGSGVILAIWARVCLGREWSLPMAGKAHPELVTNGPYATIRHPIYAGFILAVLGSTIGQTIFWAIPLCIACPYFVYSAHREERQMAEHLPLEYARYKERTYMLIPFIV